MPTHVKSRFAMKSVVAIMGLLTTVLPAAANDYPTAETVDYVLGCMAANGNNREALQRCSCSIDFIAKRLPFPDYEKAETALSLQMGGGVGGRVGLFRDPPEIKQVIEHLREVQAEANLECSG